MFMLISVNVERSNDWIRQYLNNGNTKQLLTRRTEIVTRRADNPEWVSSKSNTGAGDIALNRVSRFFMVFHFFFFFTAFTFNLRFKMCYIRNKLCICKFVFL